MAEASTNLLADFDPESDDELGAISDSDSSAGDQPDQNGARDHYVDLGKSKLRQPKVTPLGPQYRGSRVSRDDVSDEEEDDPFARDFEDEDSEEERVNGFGPGDDNGSSVEDGYQEEDDVDDTDEEVSDTDLSDQSDDEHTQPRIESAMSREDKQALVREMDTARSDVSRLIESNKADVEKGRAVKRQRSSFDALLGARIKLQKALVGTNTIVGFSSNELDAQQDGGLDAAKRAEAAAFSLWSSLNKLREEVAAARAGDKRKRSHFTANTPTAKLWSHMQSQEESSLAHRTAILQRWSRKARNEAVRPQSTLLGKTQRQTTVIDTINEHLSNRERLLKRAHTPRSCAPVQLANKVIEDEKIYDDADFYGLLLKELLEQKSQDSALASNIDVDFSLRREAKTKKNVDTKASKGRKLRYTVHEKLQNFMAPEDRRTWGERQADELFGSLFGQRLGLAEGMREDEEMEEEPDAAAEALTLFRN